MKDEKIILQIEQLRGSPDDHYGLMWLGVQGAAAWTTERLREGALKTFKERLKWFRKTHPDRIYRLTEIRILDDAGIK